MNRKILTALVLATFLGVTLAPAATAAPTANVEEAKASVYQQAQEALDAKKAEFNLPPTITREHALAVLTAKFMGTTPVPSDDDLFQAMKYIVNDKTSADSTDAPFLASLMSSVENERYLNSLAELTAKPDVFKAAVKDGSLAKMTPEAAQTFLMQKVGFSPDALAVHADFVAGLSNGQLTANQIRAAIPDIKLGVWQQSTWDTLAVTATVVYLAASPEAPGWILPHHLGLNLLYIHPRILAGITGCGFGFFCVLAYLHIDVDDLAGLTLMTHGTVDELLAQLPVSIYVDLYFFIYFCGWWICFGVLLFMYFPQTLIAADPAFVLAYPQQSSEFTTRASADVIQVLMDRLGTIAYQKGREWTSDNFQQPPGDPLPGIGDLPGAAGPGHPDLGQLATTAPLANYFGAQVNGKTAGALGNMPTPPTLPAPAGADQHWATDGVHYRTRDFGGQGQDATGFTVGFTATAVRAWHYSLFYVREGTVSADSASAVPLTMAPMTIYYDANGGYFTGGAGNVLTQDYSLVDHVA